MNFQHATSCTLNSPLRLSVLDRFIIARGSRLLHLMCSNIRRFGKHVRRLRQYALMFQYLYSIFYLIQNMNHIHAAVPLILLGSPSNKIFSLNLNLVYDDFDGRWIAHCVNREPHSMIGVCVASLRWVLSRDGRAAIVSTEGSSGGNKSENVNFRNLLWLFRCVFYLNPCNICNEAGLARFYGSRAGHFE